jgi:murein L,D-transpeptidase YafK
LTDPASVRNETEALARIIEEWRRAWEGKDIDRYMSFYSPRFTSGGKDWQEWKAYKAGLTRKYKKIRVDIDNLTLLKSGGTVLAEFTQRYQAAGFRSAGVKRLYLRQNSKKWRIVGEFFMGKEKTLVAVKKPPPSPSADIEALIDRWKGAWQRKDIKTYISCYDSSFRSRGMNLRAWKRHRQRLNRKYRDFRIDINDLKIGRVSDGTVRVTFKQDYRADRYQDLGLKELFLVKKGKLWKIKEEEWRPLQGESLL